MERKTDAQYTKKNYQKRIARGEKRVSVWIRDTDDCKKKLHAFAAKLRGIFNK